MEFMHRVIGGVTSIFIFILSYQRVRSYIGWVKLIPALVVLLLLIQIVLGGIVVLLELPVDLTTYHFANAIVIYSLILYMVFFDGTERMPTFSICGYKGIFFFFGIIIFVQAVLGAYVRHSGSGLACPDFPACLGYWIPPNLSGIILNHYVHRAIAYLITIIAIFLLIFTHIKKAFEPYRRPLIIILGLIIVQVLLGVSVIHAKLHFAVTALHLSVALLILSVVLYTWFLGMTGSYKKI